MNIIHTNTKKIGWMIKRPYSLPSQYIFETTVLLIVLLAMKKYTSTYS